MKKILKPLFCAAALVLLAGCNKFDEANATPETSNGSLIKVYANVAENDGTRANKIGRASCRERVSSPV